jgi:hypothetical protein
MSIPAQSIKKQEQASELEPKKAPDAAQTVDAEAGVGEKEVRRLLSSGRPTPQQVATILAAHPAEHDAIVIAVQRILGNAFVEQVVNGLRKDPNGPSEELVKPAPTTALPEPTEVDMGTKADELVAAGFIDENKLTNELFWLRYPAWRSMKLEVGTPGAKEWIRLRNDFARLALVTMEDNKAPAEPVKPPAPPKPAVPATPQAHVEPASEPPRPVEPKAPEPPKVEPPKAEPEPEHKQGGAGAILMAASKGATVTSSSADDQYFTQSGNSYTDSVGGQRRGWYKKSAAANTCNMTSLTMALVSIAGSEEKARDKICEVLREKGIHAGAVCRVGDKSVPVTKIINDPELLSQVQLEDLVTAAGIGKGGGYADVTKARTIARVAKDSGLVENANYFKDGRPHLRKAPVREKAKQMLAEGQRVIAGTGHHYVYLAEMRDDGMVIHDPAGARLGPQIFVHGGQPRERVNEWLRYLHNPNLRDKLMRRVSLNPRATAALERLSEMAHMNKHDKKEALEGFFTEFPDAIDFGQANFYSLEDISDFDAVLCVALGPAKEEGAAES